MNTESCMLGCKWVNNVTSLTYFCPDTTSKHFGIQCTQPLIIGFYMQNILHKLSILTVSQTLLLHENNHYGIASVTI